jgi:hypothetical protein
MNLRKIRIIGNLRRYVPEREVLGIVWYEGGRKVPYGNKGKYPKNVKLGKIVKLLKYMDSVFVYPKLKK